MDSMRELKADAINTGTIYVSCPYNPSHRILRARFQYHLVKCRRNYKGNPEEEKEICPLDATHHVNKEDLARHMEVCPNRKIVDSERYLIDSEVPEPANTYKLPEIPPCEENWDDPNEESYTYDPTPHLENQPILRTMHGATKSERKAFRQVERMKMIQFQSGQPMNTAAAAAAVGVTIDHGKFVGLGRGQNHFPLGRGAIKTVNQNKKIDLNKVLGDGVGHTVPCPVETGPLRLPKEQSLALRLAECSLNEKKKEIHSPANDHTSSINISSNDKPIEKSKDADIVSGFGLKETDKANEIGKGDNKKIPVTHDWWDYDGNNSAKGSTGNRTVNLEEYKEKVKESRLAAKMGISTDQGTFNDDDRARDFTFLDEEWQTQNRRGRNVRATSHANGNIGPLSKGRKW